jgi:hypothetical protein
LSASSSASQRRSLGRAGNASSSGAVDAKELGAQGVSAREKKRMRSKVPNQCSTRGFKGGRPDSPPSASSPLCQQDFLPRARPGETTTRNRDASVPTGCRLAEPAHGHDGAVMSVTSAEMPAPITTPTSPLRP